MVWRITDLQAGDEDLAAVVGGHFALLDEGDGGDEGLDGRGELSVGGVLHGPGDRRAGDRPVPAHDLLELRLAQAVGHLGEPDDGRWQVL